MQLFVFLYLFIVVYLTNCIVLSDVGSDTAIYFDMALELFLVSCSYFLSYLTSFFPYNIIDICMP